MQTRIGKYLAIFCSISILLVLSTTSNRIPILTNGASAQELRLELFRDRHGRFIISYPSSWTIVIGERDYPQRDKAAGNVDHLASIKMEIKDNPGPRVYVFKEPLGSPVGFNPHVNVVITEIPTDIDNQIGQAIIDYRKRSLALSLQNFDLISAKEMVINSLPSVAMEYTYKATIGDKELLLRCLQYNVVVENELLYILTATDMVRNFADNQKEFETILNSFQFR